MRLQHRDHYGPEPRQADLAHAEQVLKDQLRQQGWTEAKVGRRRKGDPEKVAIASLLRAHTTMTLKRIAQRLAMGTWTHVSNCLVQKRTNDRQCHKL